MIYRKTLPFFLAWILFAPLLFANPPNILLITADDLGYEPISSSLDLTPHLDQLAAEGMRFERAHMNTAICQPSRAVIATGRYGHASGVMGFFHMTKPQSTVMQTLRDAGYLTGILGKVDHSTPDATYQWDFVRDYLELGAGRDPEKYYGFCTSFFARCAEAGKPFYLMVNSHDPHRPFHDPRRTGPLWATPSRLFTPAEVEVPSYLPDLPGVRTELSHYYNSVRRLDDTAGRVLQALQESGQDEHTLVLFVSDNGSAFPFAKANAYLASTRTPCYVRWPGVIQPGSIDATHFISSIDFFPTFAEAAGLPAPDRVNGRSLLPLLRGEPDPDRDFVFTQIDYKIGGPATPMRCVQNEQYGYIFNPWSRPDAHYSNNNEGLAMKAMEEAAKSDPGIAARVKVFRQRTVEEFYDLKTDPGSLNNLIDDADYRPVIEAFRERLRTWMKETRDPALSAFEQRNSPEAIQQALREDYPAKPSLLSSRGSRRAGSERNSR